MNARFPSALICMAVCLCLGLRLHGQQIVQAEYFFDMDLGVGQNSSLTLIPGDTVLLSSAVPVTGLTPGYHYLYVRAKDENEQWSTALVKRLYIYNDHVPSIPQPTQIVEAEYYFLNADPGPGNGVDIPLVGADTVEVTDAISSNQFLGGVLPLNIRVRDSNGYWSYCSTDTVYKNGALLLTIANRPLVRINSLERFAFSLTNGGYAGALESFLLVGVQDTLDAYIDDNDDGDVDSALWSTDQVIDFDGFKFTLLYLDSVAPQSSHDFSLFHRMPSSPGGSEHRAALVTSLSEDIRPHEHAFRHDKLVDLLGRAHDSGRDSLPTDFLLTREEFEDSAETWLQSLEGQSQYNVLALVDTLYSLHCGVCDPVGQGLFRQAVFTILLRYSGLRDDEDGDMLGSQQPEIRSSSDGPQLGPCEPIPDKEPVCRNDSPDGTPPCDDCPNPPNPPCPLAVPLLPGPFPTTSDFCEPRCRPTHDKNTRAPLDPKPPQRHGSWDIGAPEGTLLYAPFDGNIIAPKHTTSGFCGKSLTIQAWCDPNLKMKFCHLQTILQSNGGVIGGMPIATVGKTGDVPDNRPHLHAEVSYNGTLENPFCMPMFASVVSNHPPGPQVYNDCLQCTEGRTKSEYGSIPRCTRPTVAVSIDPNIKVGPNGYDTAHYVPGSSMFTYDILFQNVDSAIVPAQYVAIRDTIDIQSFDMATFSHDLVAIGYDIYTPDTSDVYSYQDTIDTRNWNSALTAVAFFLDTLSGAAEWSFLALDTTTLQPVTDPFVGVLPPDTLPPTGSGAIRFHLRLRDTVSHDAVVSNEASIYFDTNDPINTTPWTNTVDLVAPASTVTALPAISTDTMFTVSWSGDDDGAGIEYYHVYYAMDQDTLFSPWLQLTSDTSAVFEGEINRTYYFYSVAVDSVGNREMEGLHFDAFTTVTIFTPIGSYQDPGMNLSLFPNPTTGSVTLRGRTDSGCRLGLVVRNAVGQELLTKTIGVGPGPIMEQVDLSRLAVGTYFVTVNCNDSKLLERLIRIAE